MARVDKRSRWDAIDRFTVFACGWPTKGPVSPKPNGKRYGVRSSEARPVARRRRVDPVSVYRWCEIWSSSTPAERGSSPHRQAAPDSSWSLRRSKSQRSASASRHDDALGPALDDTPIGYADNAAQALPDA